MKSGSDATATASATSPLECSQGIARTSTETNEQQRTSAQRKTLVEEKRQQGKLPLSLEGFNSSEEAKSEQLLKEQPTQLSCEVTVSPAMASYSDVLDGSSMRIQVLDPIHQVVPSPERANATAFFAREVECAALLDAYRRRCVSDTNEIILVSGASGTGKTWLISETLRHQEAFFCAGKFDQLQRPEPFAPFVAAVTEFASSLRPEHILTLKQRHGEHLNELDPRLLLRVIPALDALLDEDSSSATNESGRDADDNGHNPPALREGHRRHFLLALTNFLRIVCRSYKLVLFLDDLQWADRASLELFHMLATTQPRGLVLVGACRGNEVALDDHLAVMLRSLDSMHVMITEIKLSNFELCDVEKYVACKLRKNYMDGDVRALARMIYRQSQGNIFFVKRYMINLFDQNTFRNDSQGYYWNQEELERCIGNKTAVELISIDLKRVHKDRTYVMKVAACLGARFDEQLLRFILPKGVLMPCIHALIETEVIVREKDQISFNHDQLQRACYGLIDESDRAEFHLELGLKLRAEIPEKLLRRYIFVVASQIVRGVSVIKSKQDRADLALLCLEACKEAVSLASFGTAAAYIESGIEILGTHSFQTNYSLALALYNAGAEVAYCNGENALMKARADMVLKNARTLQDKLQAYSTQIMALGTSQKMDEAVKLGFHILRLLGERIPTVASPLNIVFTLVKTKLMLRRTNSNKILSLPKMTNPDKISAMKIWDLLFLYALLGGTEYVPFIACRHVQLTLKYGLSVMSTNGFTTYSMVLTSLPGSKGEAYKYACLGLQLSERYKSKQWESRLRAAFYGMVNPWREPFKNCVVPLRDAFYSGQRSGDFEFAALCGFLYTANATSAGYPIAPLLEEMKGFKEMFIAYGQDTLKALLLPSMQAFSLLLGEASDDPLTLTGQFMNEAEQLKESEDTNNSTATFSIYFSKATLAIQMGEYVCAEKYCRQARKFQGVASLAGAKLSFYEGLASLALYQEGQESHRLRAARKSLRHMRNCAKEAPHNFLDKAYFLEAEFSMARGNTVDALTLYRLATNLAQREGFLEEEAIYCERRALALHSRCREKEAALLFKQARDAYEKRGVVIATDRLDNNWLQPDRKIDAES